MGREEQKRKKRKGKAGTSWGLVRALLGPLSAASLAPLPPFVFRCRSFSLDAEKPLALIRKASCVPSTV